MSPRRNWDSPNPTHAIASVPFPQNPGGGAHSPAGEGLGESQFRRLENSLALCLLCGALSQYCHLRNVQWGYSEESCEQSEFLAKPMLNLSFMLYAQKLRESIRKYRFCNHQQLCEILDLSLSTEKNSNICVKYITLVFFRNRLVMELNMLEVNNIANYMHIYSTCILCSFVVHTHFFSPKSSLSPLRTDCSLSPPPHPVADSFLII
jgi:hypothetical protein